MADYSDLDESENGFPPDSESLDSVLPPLQPGVGTDGPVGVAAPAGELPDFAPAEESIDDGKPLLEVRGFYVSSGPGIYDGAQREREEPRESFFVDVQSYETGAIQRVWGVALAEAMGAATAQHDIKPGARLHLMQQDKRKIVKDEIVNNTMQFRETFANGWVCIPDRGPLPSHLAHLMAGINVDAKLDRLALRHDMAADDERLPAWKQQQKRMLAAFGEDPQTVESWLARQFSLPATEERQLVEKAVSLEGYGPADEDRKNREIEHRMSALANMSAQARYDYLMETAKPHLIEKNRELESRLAREVVSSIEQVTEMATPNVDAEAPERKAMRSGLVQSIEGLTLQQQLDYLAARREKVIANLAADLVTGEEFDHVRRLPRVSRTKPIDATGLSAEEYQQLLQERLDLAENAKEREEIIKQEAEHQKAFREGLDREFQQIDQLYQRFAAERDVDAAAFLLSIMVRSLSDIVGSRLMPKVKTTFEALGGLGAWRRAGCEAGLRDLTDTLHAAKQSGTYQAFVNDSVVVAASGDRTPDELVGSHADFVRTDAVQGHLAAQEAAIAPALTKRAPAHGLWANTMGALHSLSDRVSHLSPEHLIKGGALDSDWLTTMRSGIDAFGAELKNTLMSEQLKAQMQEMLASILAAIRVMLDLARELLTGKGPAKDAAAAAPSVALEP
ncbi:hypothetical protein [Paracidovorax wautersii]|uniref:Uncharacterized protein n=1 Tax=Paracidovorax wautersii TaxID=1177982 RepID=A0A1I2HT69_9BURK|nr:hypothetical protein [Paracidovorax wautersii]SFF31601.1 hypothetical protein SAMN04489711_12710 [Paracidovorax wautersii]